MFSLAGLGLTNPVIAAPMAGGPTTPTLVLAAANVGSIGFLAGGYKSAAALEEQLIEVGRATNRFGVNLFAPNPALVDREDFRRYAAAIEPEFTAVGIEPSLEPIEDTDSWVEKVDVLLAQPVPIVSVTFGLPPVDSLRALQAVGTLVLQTVTSVDEAKQAVDLGIDGLVVQAAAAGGHSGVFNPRRPAAEVPVATLLATLREATSLPLIVGGGMSSASHVAEALRCGAIAVAVGTALLLADEAGTSAAYRSALAEDRGDTVITRAFSGRPARALRNDFIDRWNSLAPIGYPAIHHLTSPMRKAAAAKGDAERINLWAGTGYRSTRAMPAGEILEQLASAI